jgi:hypothetical protein
MLDPNNPRLLSADRAPVPDRRIAEEQIQRRTMEQLADGPFDLAGMRSSISRAGLLPIDRIVVRPLDGNPGRHVVVEGNRRIAGAKQAMRMNDDGEITLDEGVVARLTTPRVLVLENRDQEAARTDQWVIQGIRHISGIRPWGAYQVAKTIEAMTDDLGYEPQEVAEALSIGVGRVRRALRVLSVLTQMEEDEEYGDQAKPSLFAYFDEAIRSVKVRNWLGWNQSAGTLDDDDHRSQFYSWITPDEEFEEQDRRRIHTPEGVRRLNQILDSEEALDVLNTPATDIDAAFATLGLVNEPEWRPPVTRALSALEAIPIGTLETLDEDDRGLIQSLRDLAERRLGQAATLSLGQPEGEENGRGHGEDAETSVDTPGG